MPASLHLIFPQGLPPIIRYGQDIIAHVVATRAYAWARPIFIEAGIEVLDRAHASTSEWAAGCVSFFSTFALLMSF